MSAACACQNAGAGRGCTQKHRRRATAAAFGVACAQAALGLCAHHWGAWHHQPAHAPHVHAPFGAQDSDDFCWICLDDVSKGQLINPCRCPRKVHPTCLARWQLQQAGRAEETQCRCVVAAHCRGRAARMCIRRNTYSTSQSHRPQATRVYACVRAWSRRFCNSQLADWKASLTPEPLKPEVERVQPIMVVYFEGEIHR